MEETLKIKVEFLGGAELLFNNQKCLNLDLDGSIEWTVAKLIKLLVETHIKERPEMFSIEGRIRPGILVLVNEIDFEVLGGHDYAIQPNDRILFLSTLHGG